MTVSHNYSGLALVYDALESRLLRPVLHRRGNLPQRRFFPVLPKIGIPKGSHATRCALDNTGLNEENDFYVEERSKAF